MSSGSFYFLLFFPRNKNFPFCDPAHKIFAQLWEISKMSVFYCFLLFIFSPIAWFIKGLSTARTHNVYLEGDCVFNTSNTVCKICDNRNASDNEMIFKNFFFSSHRRKLREKWRKFMKFSLPQPTLYRLWNVSTVPSFESKHKHG